jgi:integrase
MSKNGNRFLTQRNDVYYFRARIPTALSAQKKEIKLSLKTKNKSEAMKRARPLVSALIQLKAMSDYEKLLQQLKQLGVNTDDLTTYTIKGLSVGNTRIDELTVDSDNENDVKAAHNALEAILSSEHSSIPSTDNKAPLKQSLSLSGGIEKYISHKTSGSVRSDVKSRWSEKTKLEYEQAYSLLVEIVGDINLALFSYDHAEGARNKLLILPPNISKVTKYKNLSIDQIIALGDKPRSITTVNKILSRYSSLFSYLKRVREVDDNYFVGLQVQTDKTSRESRRSYTNDELVRLFTFLNSKELENYQYWCTRIALLSGLRLEEIIQLHVSDIKFIDNIAVFDVNGEHGKNLKTLSSKRRVPVHQQLIDAGFIEYVNQQKKAKQKYLFPECDHSTTGRRSHAASKWFGNIRKNFGWVNLSPKLDFHSFRVTVATMLQRAEVSEFDTACILGHGFGKSESYVRYADTSELAKLKEIINLIKYDFVDI